MSRIWLSSPHMSSLERMYMIDAFDSNWVAPLGPYVNKFEASLSELLDNRPVAALNSGTAAIHLALIMLQVEKDDYVICQSMTFAASANPITYLGAVPVFVDSEKDSWNMDPELLRRAIQECNKKGKLPKAIIAVHLYGMPAMMDEILQIADDFSIPVIEDAAEALGSKISDKPCGSFGKFGILSFNGNKIITTSGGGAIISSENSFIEKARFLATQARDAAPHYEHSQIGYNYRMSNICAAIGCGQIENLSSRVASRRANYEFYRKKLGEISGIHFLPERLNVFSNRWLTTVLFDKSITNKIELSLVQRKLEEKNIETRPLWKPMHLQPVFKSAPAYLNGVSEELFSKGMCLPSGSNLTEEDLERVIDAFTEIVQ